MPYESDAQRRWAHTKRGKVALGGDKAVAHWDKESKDMKLPEKIKKADVIPGGLADDKTNSDFPKKKVKQGSKVEMEHTSNKRIAQEIARDHLVEDADYYNKLKEVEAKKKTVNPVKGLEVLAKEPVAKSEVVDLAGRWSLVKADLNNEEAIVNIAGGDEDEEASEGAMAQGVEGSEGSESNVAGDEVVPQAESEAVSEQPEGDAAEAEAVVQGEAEPQEVGGNMEEALRNMGYDDHEIAHVVHGHDLDDVHESDDQDQEQDGLDHNSAVANKFKMELDAFKRRQDLELKYFEEEMKQKLTHTHELHQQKLGHNDEDAKLRRDMQKQKHEKSLADKKEDNDE